jgi:hypothetical protein
MGPAMEFKKRTLMQIADMICGNSKEGEPKYFRYRSSSYLSEFFEDCGTDYRHDGSTRNYWVADTLKTILAEPQTDAKTPPAAFSRVIRVLMDQSDAVDEERHRPNAMALLNTALAREGYKVFYAADRQCQSQRKHQRKSKRRQRPSPSCRSLFRRRS